ncbi:MAG: sigma-70 family RNA polymerase sigma factor [Anaerolineales bacterium]|nr:sigma-70 family RNA polymerase sigma factor [Anaerolineales bacterium]MCB9128928.1 sigma-70 family RNA polymerase sigma factor [Ardenticatenales bacterium]
MHQEADGQLIEQAKSDSEAFGKLYEIYVDRIYRYLYVRVGDEQVAEELTSRCFMRVLKALPRYVDRGAPFAAWLYRIAYNLLANHYRDSARRETMPLDTVSLHGDSHQEPPHTVELWDTIDSLKAAIGELHEDRKLLLHLKFTEGLSNAQIGEMMGRTEGAIKSLYHRTLTALREGMQNRGFGAPERESKVRGVREP